MKIIISPAKKMREEDDFFCACTTPLFSDRAEAISRRLSEFNESELKSLFKCNDAIAKLNFDRYQKMDFDRAFTPAILAYDGIAFKYMAPMVFENKCFDYVQNHLIILSALYGGLKPLDRVVLYRLEMQAKLSLDSFKNLYEYWGSDIYDELLSGEDIINLASAEYSKAVKKYALQNAKWVDVIFGQLIDNKVVEKGVYVKMARGEMVAFMAENNVRQSEEIKSFDRLGYKFNDSLSSENEYIFIKK